MKLLSDFTEIKFRNYVSFMYSYFASLRFRFLDISVWQKHTESSWYSVGHRAR